MNTQPLLIAGMMTFLAGAAALAATPHDDPDNQLFTYGYSVPAGNGLDASVITLPGQPVARGFRGQGYGAACANEGTEGPDCE